MILGRLLSQLRRRLAYAVYYLVLKKLPRSYAPGGRLAAILRRAAARYMLDYSGQDVNIEAGAHFGSGRGIRLGDRSGIGVDCDLHGTISIGDDVMMGPRCTMLSRDHRTDRVDVPMNTQGFGEDRPIRVCDDVWIGANVTILSGVTVGEGAIIAAGAVVTRDVAPYTVVGGVPARTIASRTDPHRGAGS